MPHQPPRACRTGCGQATTAQDGLCRACRTRRPQRPSAAKRGYDRVHQAWRAEGLRLEPYCRPCGARGMRVVGTVADHIVPVRLGGRWTAGNRMTLCASCHAVKRAAESRGHTVRIVAGRGFVEVRGMGGRDSSDVTPPGDRRARSRARSQVFGTPAEIGGGA